MLRASFFSQGKDAMAAMSVCPRLLSGRRLTLDFQSASADSAAVDETQRFGFRCIVSGYCTIPESFCTITSLERELTLLCGSCAHNMFSMDLKDSSLVNSMPDDWVNSILRSRIITRGLRLVDDRYAACSYVFLCTNNLKYRKKRYSPASPGQL